MQGSEAQKARRRESDVSLKSLPGLVTLLLVLLHYRASGNLLRSFPITAGALGFILDVLVLAALFAAYASQTSSSGHVISLLRSTIALASMA
jgi:hypothetical protein